MMKNLKRYFERYKEVNCTCQTCVSFCKNRPGWFRPSQIPKLAKFLKMAMEKLFAKYLIADFYTGDNNDIYVLSPVKDFDWVMKFGNMRNKTMVSFQFEHNKFMDHLMHNDISPEHYDKAGSRASWGYAFIHAPCIFLENDRCKIYPIRPFECAVTRHDSSPSGIRELIANEWKQTRLIERML